MFKIPTIPEIKEHILYKQPSWPEGFIDYMADKFFNHYQSVGWRLSSNVLIKDWRACFNSRWNSLPYTEDRAKLEGYKNAEIKRPKTPIVDSLEAEEDDHLRTCRYIDDLMKDYRQGLINRDGMAEVYKWLRIQGLIRFTKEEVEKLVADAGNDKSYGRYLSTKLLFTKLIEQGITFSDYLKTRA